MFVLLKVLTIIFSVISSYAFIAGLAHVIVKNLIGIGCKYCHISRSTCDSCVNGRMGAAIFWFVTIPFLLPRAVVTGRTRRKAAKELEAKERDKKFREYITSCPDLTDEMKALVTAGLSDKIGETWLQQ